METVFDSPELISASHVQETVAVHRAKQHRVVRSLSAKLVGPAETPGPTFYRLPQQL